MGPLEGPFGTCHTKPSFSPVLQLAGKTFHNADRPFDGHGDGSKEGNVEKAKFSHN
jgi:hypothetical protein